MFHSSQRGSWQSLRGVAYTFWDDFGYLSYLGPATDGHILETEIPEKLNTHTLFSNLCLKICDLPNRFLRGVQENVPSLLCPSFHVKLRFSFKADNVK